MIVRDEIISVMDIISATMTNTTSTNVTKNCHNKKVRYKFDCYIFLHSFISDHITIDNDLLWKMQVKTKRHWCTNNMKMENNEFRKVRIKDSLSGLIQFWATESPLKMMKNAFYFTSKALFVLKIFKFLFCLFGHVLKRFD